MKFLGRLCAEPDEQPSTPAAKTAYAVQRLDNPPAASTNDLADQPPRRGCTSLAANTWPACADTTGSGGVDPVSVRGISS